VHQAAVAGRGVFAGCKPTFPAPRAASPTARINAGTF
jgi:hypothetical protein